MGDRHGAYQNEIASFVFGETAEDFSHDELIGRSDK